VQETSKAKREGSAPDRQSVVNQRLKWEIKATKKGNRKQRPRVKYL
jgi:hypothetical protein